MIKKNGISFENIELRAKQALGQWLQTPAHELINLSAHLKFTPAQRPRRRELLSRAHLKLSKDNNADFCTYELLYKEALEVFILDTEKCGREIVSFAVGQMKALSLKALKDSRRAEEYRKAVSRIGIAVPA